MGDRFPILLDLIKLGLSGTSLSPAQKVDALAYLTTGSPSIVGEVDSVSSGGLSLADMAKQYLAWRTAGGAEPFWAKTAEVVPPPKDPLA